MKTKRSAALQETVVTSERLCLRPMKNEEWKRIVDSAYENDEFLFQFGFEGDESYRESLANPNTEEVIYYSVFQLENSEMIGYVGLSPESNNLEFYVYKEQRRKGYASEAISLFINACAEGLITGKPHKEFFAGAVHTNDACVKLLNKLNFKKTGIGFNISSGVGFLGFEYAAR